MKKNFTQNAIDNRLHLHIFKTLFITVNIAVLLIYAMLRIIFYDMPFEPMAEGIIILKTLGIGSIIAVSGSFIFLVADAIDYFVYNKKQITWRVYHNKALAGAAAVLLVMFLVFSV